MAAHLQLHNTLTRRKEPFEPIDRTNVRMYACGPTVYQRIHIGNARPLVVFDVLFRLLRQLFGDAHVTYVRNITDIDDKIIAQARADGEAIEALTAHTAARFFEDARDLGCLEPTHQPRATDHLPEMIALVGALIERGHAYPADGHVLFHVPSMPAYGQLSGRNRDDMIAGARVEVAPYKRDPADFVLWKPSTPDQPGWASPWGRGRPGWHLECSAMSERFLALPFDIHAGGLDLVFPHHENELAQSCCARGVERMADVWLHNGFVTMAAEKMSKSLGNIVRMDAALATAPGEAIRFWILGSHYRQPLSYTDEALHEAKAALDRFYGALARHPAVDGAARPDPELEAALCDDLNTPLAIARLHELLATLNKGAPVAATLHASAGLLGLLQAEPDAWLKGGEADDLAVRVETLIAERQAARRTKDFARADAIRAELTAAGVILEDSAQGTTWRRV